MPPSVSHRPPRARPVGVTGIRHGPISCGPAFTRSHLLALCCWGRKVEDSRQRLYECAWRRASRKGRGRQTSKAAGGQQQLFCALTSDRHPLDGLGNPKTALALDRDTLLFRRSVRRGYGGSFLFVVFIDGCVCVIPRSLAILTAKPAFWGRAAPRVGYGCCVCCGGRRSQGSGTGTRAGNGKGSGLYCSGGCSGGFLSAWAGASIPTDQPG